VPFNGRILTEYYRGSLPGLIFDHPDEIGSATTSSDYTGKTINEKLFYPFGELWTGAGSCGMHQTFAQLPDYDSETDQYNTPNRHYNPTGRWLSPDPLGGQLEDPQTLNKYAYVRNNPITLTDPTGLYMCADDPKDAKEHCTSDKDRAFESQRQEALRSGNGDVVRGASAYGDPGRDNGVTVRFGDPGAGNNGDTTHDIETDLSRPNGIRPKETVTVRDTLTGTDLKDALSHEGSHVADAQEFVGSINANAGTFDFTKNLTKYQTELGAYMVTQSVLSSANEKHTYDCGLMGACQLGAGVTDVTGNINRLLDYQYHVTPQNQGSRLYPQFTPLPPNATTPH
jgi:RHS repeat-associated protein